MPEPSMLVLMLLRNGNMIFPFGSGEPWCYAGTMLSAADARRRWFGLFCLGMAFGMLAWGQTVLKPYLDGLWFLLYWAGCFLFTIASIWIALLDLRATRRRTREEQRDLIQRTLEEVDAAQERRTSQDKD